MCASQKINYFCRQDFSVYSLLSLGMVLSTAFSSAPFGAKSAAQNIKNKCYLRFYQLLSPWASYATCPSKRQQKESEDLYLYHRIRSTCTRAAAGICEGISEPAEPWPQCWGVQTDQLVVCSTILEQSASATRATFLNQYYASCPPSDSQRHSTS